MKQQKVFDEKLGDKHQKWVQQQWRRYSTSPGSVCVLSLGQQHTLLLSGPFDYQADSGRLFDNRVVNLLAESWKSKSKQTDLPPDKLNKNV